jgi:hypothetical protein
MAYEPHAAAIAAVAAAAIAGWCAGHGWAAARPAFLVAAAALAGFTVYREMAGRKSGRRAAGQVAGSARGGEVRA